MNNYHRSTSFAEQKRRGEAAKQNRKDRVETLVVVGILLGVIAAFAVAYYGGAS